VTGGIGKVVGGGDVKTGVSVVEVVGERLPLQATLMISRKAQRVDASKEDRAGEVSGKIIRIL